MPIFHFMKLFIFIFFIYANQLYAQDVVQVKVVDSLSRKGVDGVTLSINGKVVGQSDKNGSFTVELSETNKTDILTFSSIRYFPKKIAVRDLLNGMVIYLSENARQLSTVTISKRKSKPKWLYEKNRNNNSFSNAYSIGFREIAKGFVAAKAGLWLKRVKLPKYYCENVVIRYRSRFILHIYDVDTATGGPGRELFNREIYLNQGEYRPIIPRETPNSRYYEYPSRDDVIDLSKFAIVTPNKIFFVGIERLRIPFNEVLIDLTGDWNSFDSRSLSRNKSSYYMRISYLPFISANFFSKWNQVDPKYVMNWCRDTEGKWTKQYKWTHDSISGESLEAKTEILIDVEMVD